MQICKREAKCKQEAKQLNWYRSSLTEKQYKNKEDQAKATINQDKTTDEMWTTFFKKVEHQISSTVTEGEELKCIYKNYIHREKN